MSNTNFIKELYSRRQLCAVRFPDKVMAIKFVDSFFEFLFIPEKQKKLSEQELSREFESFRSYLSTLIYDVVGDGIRTQQIADGFFNEVPLIYAALLKDAAAILEFDPAAVSIEEVLMAYPGFYATAVHRLSHQLFMQMVPIFAPYFC